MPGVGNMSWPPVNMDSVNFLHYSDSETAAVEEIKINPHSQRMDFWNDFYAKYYIPPKAASSSRILGVALILVVCQLFVKLL